MPAEVYFAQRRATGGGGLMEKIEQLLDAAGFAQLMEPGDPVAIKTHFGERGNTTHVRPEIVRRVVRKVKTQGGRPFVTDTNARRSESRTEALGHLALAAEHGFTAETLGAPVLIADGLTGEDGTALGGLATPIASALAHARTLIVVSHVTMHPVVGFAGALYQLGFGAMTRAARLAMVESGDRVPAGVGAGELSSEPVELALPIAEALTALHAAKPGRILYCNVLLDITPDPDGAGWSDAAVLPDVGLLVSKDPVGIDQATADFLNMQTGIPGTRLSDLSTPDKIRSLHPEVDWQHLLKTCERHKLGSRDYELLII